MTFNVKVASFGRPVEITDEDTACITGLPLLTLAFGKGAKISVSRGILSVWFVECGHVQVNASGSCFSLCEGLHYVNADGPLQLSSMGEASWLGISIPARVLHNLVSDPHTSSLALQSLVELTDSCTRAINKCLIHAVHEHALMDTSYQLSLAEKMFLLESQAKVELSRCPGRTDRLRRQSFQRLCKARLHIASNPGQVERISGLAEIANYSDGHFIRMFSKVFQETPMEYAHRLRMTRAKQLIRAGRLSLLEISSKVGFITFSAFCRSFRTETGLTPSAFRSSAATQPHQSLRIEKSLSAH